MRNILVIVLPFILWGWVVGTPQRLCAQKPSKSWRWHSNGGFKYPNSYNHSIKFVEDAPASVEVFSNGIIQLCYWPLLGMWTAFADFPREGDWLSSTERVRTVTYRANSKLIVSGYTQNGNIFYLNQKISSGGEVKHSKVLVLIYPQSEKNVSALINIVRAW